MSFFEKLMAIFISKETLALIRVALRKDDPLIVEALKQLKMSVKLIDYEELQAEIKKVDEETRKAGAAYEEQEKVIKMLQEELESERALNRKEERQREPREVHPWKVDRWKARWVDPNKVYPKKNDRYESDFDERKND